MKYVARWNGTNYQVFTSMDYACEFAREASRKYNTDGIVIEVCSDAFDFIRYGPTYTNGLRTDSGWTLEARV